MGGETTNGSATIALAVDGLEPQLIESWVEAGELSNISKIRQEGASGTAECSSLSSAVQWTTHFTGLSPEDHSITGFLKEGEKRTAGDPAPDARELINLSDIQVKTYPKLLEEAGLRVGLINPLPIWPPLELENGFCVSGLLTPPTADQWVHPPELKSKLDQFGYKIDVRYGNRPYGFVDDELFEEVSIERLYGDMFEVLDARIKFTKHAIQEREFDFLYSLLKSIDVIQHCFWAHMVNDDPVYGDAILESYRRVDDLIGWIHTETDANIVVFSDHGFGPRSPDSPYAIDYLTSVIGSVVPLPRIVRKLHNSLLMRSSVSRTPPVSVSSTTGTHADPAAWMLAGPDIESDFPSSIKFEDLTATVLALLDQEIPERYDGKPVTAISKEWNYVDRSLSVRRETTYKDHEVISDRLHNLGYAEMVDDY